MPTFTRQTWVDAPLSDVWQFHTTVDGLLAVTPKWMRLRVDAVHGPSGDETPGELDGGSTVTLSVRPFGVGPRRASTVRITRMERGDGTRVFEDRMVEGPFARWEHTHQFFADGDRTLVRDIVEYELPFSMVGRAVTPVAQSLFGLLFRQRHRRTRKLFA